MNVFHYFKFKMFVLSVQYRSKNQIYEISYFTFPEVLKANIL